MRLLSCFVALAALAFCAPLAAQEQWCAGESTSIPSTNTPTSASFEIDSDDAVDLGDLELSVNITTLYVGSSDYIDLESAEGTSQRLHDSRGGSTFDFDCVYSSYGDSNAGSAFGVFGDPSIYNCGGCRFKPAGYIFAEDSDMTAFTGENTEGEWTLTMTTFVASTINDFCVINWPVPGVTDLSCDVLLDEGPGIVELSWTNNVDVEYTDIEIWFNGLLLAELDGADETWNNYGDTLGDDSDDDPLPVPQLGEFAVVAYVDTDQSLPAPCNAALPAEVVAEANFEPTEPVDFGGTFGDWIGILVFEDDVTITDVAVSVDLTHGFIGYVDVNVASNSGTSVQMHNNQGSSETAIDVTYSQFGVANGLGGFACGCLMQPSGPGLLSDWAGEDTINDDDVSAWAGSISAYSTFYSGAINSLGIQVFEDTPAVPVTDIACTTEALDLGLAEVTWTNGGDYEEIRVWQNDVLVDELTDGPYLEGETGSFTMTDAVDTLPTTVKFTVRGYVASGASSLKQECSLRLEVPPITDFGCAPGADEGTIDVSWTNSIEDFGDEYDSMELYIDGDLVDPGPEGTDTSFTIEGPLEVPGVYNVELRANLDAFDASTATVDCNVMLLEAADIEECVSPGVTGADTFDIEIFDVYTIKEVELAVEIRSTFVYGVSIDLNSPTGVSAAAKAANNGPTSGNNAIFCVFDNDGDNPGSGTLADYDCGCAILPPNSSFNNFVNEVSDGTWTTDVNITSAFYEVTTNSLCLRINGCDFLSPQDFAVEPSDDSVDLSWTIPTGSSYDEIKVYQNGVEVDSLDGDAEEATISDLEAGRYNFHVEGVDSDGCGAGTPAVFTAIGFDEVCADVTEITATIVTSSVEYADPIQVGEVDVRFDGFAYYTPYELTLTSPSGTDVSIYERTNYAFNFGEMNAVFVDGGTDTYTGQFPQCGLCEVEPDNPLSAFAEEIADGDWEMLYRTVTTYCLTPPCEFEWCLGMYEGCETIPPSDLEAEEDGSDVVLTWENNEDYNSIDVVRNGVTIAKGLDGDETEYTDEGPLADFYFYQLRAEADDESCFSGSRSVRIAKGIRELCDSPGVSTGATAGSSVDAVQSFDEDIAIDDVQVFVDITSGWAYYLTITLEDPEGDDITLKDTFEGNVFGADVVCFFTDDGETQVYASPYNCGDCEFAPIDLDTTLADIAEGSPEGDWTMTLLTGSSYDQTLNEWCLNLFEGCQVERPADLEATTKDGFIVDLTWSIPTGSEYDAFRVIRDGEEIAELDGDVTEYTDAEASSGLVEYIVIGDDDELGCGRPSLPAVISVGKSDVCIDEDFEVPASDVLAIRRIDWQNEELEGCNSETIDELGLDESAIVINDVHVTVSATSTFIGYLDLTLFSPNDTGVRLAYGNLGSSGTEWDNITFSDDAALSGYQATVAPDAFVRPQLGMMADFADEDARGEWLMIANAFAPQTITDACIGVFADQCDTDRSFIRGDCDNNGSFSALLDAQFALNYQFNNGPTPPCFAQADVDGNGSFSALLDAQYALNYQFNNGPTPPAPGPDDCGEADADYDLEDIGCEETSCD